MRTGNNKFKSKMGRKKQENQKIRIETIKTIKQKLQNRQEKRRKRKKIGNEISDK